MSKERNHIGFTANLRMLVNVLAQDPSCKAEIEAGLTDAPLPLITSLGAANLSPGPGTEDIWCSLYPATVNGKKPGEAGLFYRNNTKGGKGDRVQMRLRRQEKRQEVVQQSVAPVIPDLNDPAVAAAVAKHLAAAGYTLPLQAGQGATPATSPAIPDEVARAMGVKF